MKAYLLIVCQDSTTFTCSLRSKKSEIKTKFAEIDNVKDFVSNSRIFTLNHYELRYFLDEIDNCPTSRRSLVRNIRSSDIPFVIKLIPAQKELIDKVWGEIVRYLIWETLEINYMMSWLSTLGGAFSALGDYFDRQAEIAGKISVQQIKLALRLDDPGLTARCFLYFSISQIQKHKFNSAKFIVQRIYLFATEHEDSRLTKMCLGIWSKLQYTHKIARLNQKSSN